MGITEVGQVGWETHSHTQAYPPGSSLLYDYLGGNVFKSAYPYNISAL